MIWFNGSIQSAVSKVKSSCSFLLVFVQGDDDLSKRYEKSLDEGIKLKSEDFVPIKISHNSVAHEQLKKIYVTVPVPSVFIIGTNGIPFAIICTLDPSNLNNAITEAIDKQKKQNGTHIANNNGRDKKIPLVKDEAGTCHKVNSPDEENNVARIQFRLPSNEVRSWEFPNLCTLHDVRLYLMETVNLRQGFKLLRTFPRIAFTSQDESKTLTELALTPNATLIVVPVQDEAIHSKIKKILTNNNLIFSIVSAIFQPVFAVFGYFSKYFHRSSGPKKIGHIGRDRPESRHKRRKMANSNIHGFAFDESDTDSDMNTDNGNSTQQK